MKTNSLLSVPGFPWPWKLKRLLTLCLSKSFVLPSKSMVSIICGWSTQKLLCAELGANRYPTTERPKERCAVTNSVDCSYVARLNRICEWRIWHVPLEGYVEYNVLRNNALPNLCTYTQETLIFFESAFISLDVPFQEWLFLDSFNFQHDAKAALFYISRHPKYR